MDELSSRRRASDADRKRTVDLLLTALAAGEINVNEFEERSITAWAAVYRDELQPLVADVSAEAEVERREETVNTRGEGGNTFSLAIMGGSDLSGRRHCAANHTSLNVMGGSTLDLSVATLTGPATTITCIDVMGGADIKVPEDYRLVTEGFSLMGGHEVKDAPGVTLPLNQVAQDAPTIIVRNYALMGGATILRVPRQHS